MLMEKDIRKFKNKTVISRNVSDNSINVNEGRDINNNNNECHLTPEEKVVKAETLQALKFVSSNHSFATGKMPGLKKSS